MSKNVTGSDLSESLTLDLPMPPSTNTIWRRRAYKPKTGTKWKSVTYLNKTYVQWKERAKEALQRQLAGEKKPFFYKAFEVEIVVTSAKRYTLDLDNRVKAVLDWAAENKLIANDKFAERITLKWGEAPLGVRVTFSESS